MLHASDGESIGKEKIEPFVNKLCKSFQNAFYPYQNVSIDEMVVKWQGRWKCKQYNPNKPKNIISRPSVYVTVLQDMLTTC